MKNVKTIIAAMLAVIMAVCMIPFASAVEAGDTVVWTFDGVDDMEFPYEGNLFATNKITNEDLCREVYSYTPDKSGYYSVEIEYGDFFVAETFDFTEGKAHGQRECIYTESENEEIYYFDAGETVAIGACSYKADGALDIGYYGAEISEIIMADGMLENLIIDCDIPANSAEFSLFANAAVIFDSGKSIKTETVDFVTADGKNIKEGENEVNAVILGEEFAFTMTAYNVDKFVKSMSLTNSENYIYIYEDYKGFWNGKDISGEYIEVTFADGKSLSCPYDGDFRRADFCNGRLYYVFARYDSYEEALEVGFASEVNATASHDDCYVVTRYDCEKVTGDMDHNLSILEKNLDLLTEEFEMSGKSLSEFFYVLKSGLKNGYDCFVYCFKALVNVYF